MNDCEPILLAFEQEGRKGFFNVWRYDLPSTKRVFLA